MRLSSIKRALRIAERFGNRFGYRLRWVPQVFFERPDAELSFDLEFVIAHLMLRKKRIFFVQIGANDGKTHDPLYKFVNEFEWEGILVEPQPEVFEQLTANYGKSANRLKFINAAISAEDGNRTMYSVRIDAGTYSKAHMFSSFDRSTIARQSEWVPDITQRVQERTVRCISMSTLLREAEGHDIDLLQIDAEGYDYDILRMIDFSELRPTIICFEHAHLSKQRIREAYELLFSHGYRKSIDNLDTIAYRQPFTYGWRPVRPQNIECNQIADSMGE